MNLLAAILSWLFKLMTSTKPSSTVKVANEQARESADIARTTTAETHEDIAHATAETDHDLDRLRRADSVSDTARITAEAVARANREPGADN